MLALTNGIWPTRSAPTLSYPESAPHKAPSNLFQIDPRVDSRDNDPRSPDSGYTTQHKSGYNNPTSNTGYDTSNTTSPPYTSKFSTKGNPPVDSDGSKGNYANYDNSTGNYSSLTGKYGSKLSGTAQSNTAPTTTGPHRSDWANKVDPRVDSDDSRGRYGNTTGAYNNSNAGTNYGTNQGDSETARPHKSDLLNKLDPRIDSDKGGSRNDGVGQGMGQGVGSSNTAVIPQDISSHGHATGAPASALEGKHGKHISGQHHYICITLLHNSELMRHTGNVANATASASVSGGMNPEGSANASGPTSADAGTTTSYQGGLRGAIRDMVPGTYDAAENGHSRVNPSSGNNTFDNQREGGQQQGEYVPRHRNY